MAPNNYEVGDRVRIQTDTPFQDAAGTAFDPDVVRFEVKAAAGATVAYVYGAVGVDNITKLAIGDYACDVDVDTAGTWHYYILGETTAGVNRGAHQGYFYVKAKVT